MFLQWALAIEAGRPSSYRPTFADLRAFDAGLHITHRAAQRGE